jgi:hypothetical protein
MIYLHLRLLAIACMIWMLGCNNPKHKEDKAVNSASPVRSKIEFQFFAHSIKDADSLKQAFAVDSLYQVDTVLEMEKSLWAVGVKTPDSMLVNSADEDSTIEALSKKLQLIGERYHCELTGFAHD